MAVVTAHVHGGSPGILPNGATCASIIPGAVPGEVVYGPTMISTMGQSDPTMGQVAQDNIGMPLTQWIDERMQLDRVALCLHLEQQQRNFLSDFQKQNASYLPHKRVLPKKVSSSWKPSKSISFKTACTEDVIQSPEEPKCEKMPEDSQDPEMAGASEYIVQVKGLDSASASKKRFSSLFTSSTEVQPFGGAPSRLQRVERFVEGSSFELLCIVIICLNAISIALEQQYKGQDAGYKLGFKSYSKSAEELMPGAPHIFNALDKVFVGIFLLELILRLVATRRRWFYSLWNYLDLSLIVFAIASWSLPDMMNPTFVRLVRFGKLVRIIRVMRSNKVLESLKLLSASIQASFNTLCLSFFVIILISAVAGMLLSQLVEPYICDTSNPEHVRKEVFAYYGTFWRSMITMFEITFANWAPTCRLLVDNVSESFGIFFLLHRCVVGFAMLSVIQAVFIQQTMKSAQLDEDFMVQQKRREKESYAAKLRNVFQQLDVSGDGELSWEEFDTLVSDNHMKLLMNTLEVDVRDLKTLFLMLEDGQGRIKSDEFVAGLQRIKGPAQSLDMVNLLRIVGRIESRLTGSKSKSFASVIVE